MDALKILDSDCWRLVFRNLNADDLLSCRQVCKPFHQLLDEKGFQRKWKFQLVLPLLIPLLKSMKPKEAHEYSIRDVSWKDFHNLRLVCQSWRQSVDKYVSEEYQPPFAELCDLPLITFLNNLEDFEEFQQKFGGNKTNPFPSRTVFISHPETEDVPDNVDNLGYEEYEEVVKSLKIKHFEAYVQKVIELDFVEQFGKNIFKLELCFNHQYAAGPLSFCKLINKITIHMKNLKIFYIGIGKDYGGEGEVHGQENELVKFIEENALGELPKLKALHINRLDVEIENYLLEKYALQLTHLERISITNGNASEQAHAQLLRNVESLTIELPNPEVILEILEFLESPLKYLNLSISGRPGFNPYLVAPLVRFKYKCWNMDEVLRILKHLPLDYLEIRLHATIYVTEAGLKLEEYINENIRTLRIHFYHHRYTMISFNFLEAFKKLENLELRYSQALRTQTMHPGDLMEVIRLNEYLLGKGGIDVPYQSNVWEKVPSLKTLTVEMARRNPHLEEKYDKSIYTREKYESFRIGLCEIEDELG